MRLVILAGGQSTKLRGPNNTPKQFMAVGERTLLNRYLALSNELNAEPLIITNPMSQHFFDEVDADVRVYDNAHLLDDIYSLRSIIDDNFAWISGDMFFTDNKLIKKLVDTHIEEKYCTSLFYVQSERFKAKFVPNSPQIFVTRNAGYTFSIPNFLVHSKKIFEYLEDRPPDDFINRAILSGEKVRFVEYTAPVFEIDDYEDLAQVDEFFRNES